MLQSRWTETGIELLDVEPPPLKPGWVRLKVAACGICGSDVHRLHRHVAGGTPGHEFVGTVLSSESPLPDGLYTGDPWPVCGQCEYCRSGRRLHCPSTRIIGVHEPGAVSEYVDVPRENLYAVDASLSPREASMTEPFAVSVRAVHLAHLGLESRVLVLGGGTLGLISGLLARDFAAKVGVTVRYPHQREAASKLGLEPIDETGAQEWAAENRPDVVIETVGGSANTMDEAVRACEPCGRIVVVGLFEGAPGLNLRTLVQKELTITGSKAFGIRERVPEFGAAAAVLPRYRGEIEVLQTHAFTLNEAGAALACAADKTQASIKVTIMP
jgi:threonine dehydrogenase-like Zn-dependent dehydrogenase